MDLEVYMIVQRLALPFLEPDSNGIMPKRHMVRVMNEDEASESCRDVDMPLHQMKALPRRG